VERHPEQRRALTYGRRHFGSGNPPIPVRENLLLSPPPPGLERREEEEEEMD
jgi:hypothetical protein